MYVFMCTTDKKCYDPKHIKTSMICPKNVSDAHSMVFLEHVHKQNAIDQVMHIIPCLIWRRMKVLPQLKVYLPYEEENRYIQLSVLQ